MNTRNNSASSLAVAEGIRIDQEKGAAIAWSYLIHHNIPTKVILRILTNAKSRRPTDPASATLDEQRARREVISKVSESLRKEQAS